MDGVPTPATGDTQRRQATAESPAHHPLPVKIKRPSAWNAALVVGLAFAGFSMISVLNTPRQPPLRGEGLRSHSLASRNAARTTHRLQNGALTQATGKPAATVAQAHAAAVRMQSAQARARAQAMAAAQVRRAQAAAARAAQHAQEQADLRSTVGQLYGASQVCSDAAQTASPALKAVTNGSGDSVTAYQDAQAVRDACMQARADLMAVPIPDDLSGRHLDQARSSLEDWAGFEDSFWQDIQKVLQNEGDVTSAADARTQANWAQQAQSDGVVKIVAAAMTLGVDPKSISPIAPHR